jgi:preprotein translocase subunit SecD
MKRYVVWFNIVLSFVVLAVCTGCRTLQKDASTLYLHLETPNADVLGKSMVVEVGQETMFTLSVEKDAFLSAGHVAKASVVHAMGFFEIMIEFDRHGTWTLEQYTTAYRGRRIAIMSQFGKARWLAAPRINKTIKDGIFIFTPDCTKEEADRLVKGLNNVAKTMQKNNP